MDRIFGLSLGVFYRIDQAYAVFPRTGTGLPPAVGKSRRVPPDRPAGTDAVRSGFACCCDLSLSEKIVDTSSEVHILGIGLFSSLFNHGYRDYRHPYALFYQGGYREHQSIHHGIGHI